MEQNFKVVEILDRIVVLPNFIVDFGLKLVCLIRMVFVDYLIYYLKLFG